MLALERKNRIIELINSEGKVIVATLAREFNVTEETIRRDLDKLEKDGMVIKTYGGALANVNKSSDVPYAVRKKNNIVLKQKIAEKVASMIKDGDQIMLDASTTSLFVVRQIKARKNITIITNSIEILLELADKTGWTILSTGGSLREGSYSLGGSSAEKMVRDHHVDIAVCSAKGIDGRMGVTESNEKDAEMKQAIFAAASTRILAIDNTKFDNIAFIKVCDIKDTDIIVTDKDPGETWKKRIAEAGVTLMAYGENDENFSN